MLDTLPISSAPKVMEARENSTAKYASWCLVALLLLATVGSRGGGAASSGEGDMVRQLGYILASAATFYVCRSARWLHLLPLTMVLALGWSWVSLAWAIEPAIGFRRLVLTCMLMVAVFAAVQVAGIQRTLRALIWLGLFILALNYVWVFGTSSGVHRAGEIIGDPTLAGNWRGAMGHKNYAGPFTAVTILALLFGPRLLPIWLHWPAIGMGAVFLWGTQSMTSIGLFGMCVVAGILFSSIGGRGRRLLLPTLALLVLLAAITFGPEISIMIDGFHAYLQRPEAVTGRGEIWLALGQYISQNWVLGSGYGSLWGIGPSGPIQRLVSSWVEDVYQGHNGYLDILGMLGLPGLILCLFSFFIVPMVRLTTTKAIAPATGALLFSIILFSLGHNFTESTLLTRDLVVWLLHTMALAVIFRSLRAEADASSDAARVPDGGKELRRGWVR